MASNSTTPKMPCELTSLFYDSMPICTFCVLCQLPDVFALFSSVFYSNFQQPLIAMRSKFSISLDRLFAGTLVCLLLLSTAGCTKQDSKKKKKDPKDFTDADIERLWEEWEESDEPLEEDELPEWKRKPKPMDFSKLDMSNPEALLAASKQGKPIMMFVTVAGNPTKQHVEHITGLWQTSLYNNHMDVQRFEIEEKRVIFMFKEGQQAFEAVKWLVEQDEVEEVTLEGKTHKGKGAKKPKDENAGKDDKKDEKMDKKDSKDGKKDKSEL